MSDLRATAAFFRCSLDEAIRLATDRDVLAYAAEWVQDPRFAPGRGW